MFLHLGIHSRRDWTRLLSGLVLIFALFHGLANALGSDRGQSGLLVAAIVLATTIAVDQLLLRHPRSGLVQRLGLKQPRVESLVVAGAATVPLLLIATFFSLLQAVGSVTWHPGWLGLLPGLFAQAGVAEEVLFRAYLFGQIRTGRTFWRAAMLSMLPFVGVHLAMFATMPWPVALAGLALAATISFPLAYLFELGGNTIWAPAILHFVIQAVPKVVVFSQGAQSFALMWMVASAVVPLIVLARKTD